MELDPVDRITADAVGEPGRRTFYVQAHQGDRTVTVLVEKEQIQQLAASIVEILSRVERDTESGPGDDELQLEPPLEPLFRAGRLYIGYEEERDRLLLDIEELLSDEDREAEREPARVRLWATREQMLALSRHGAQAVSRGRPACRFCGNPIDPEGHTCPAMNGHRG